MLLLDNDDRLPASPTTEEAALTDALGPVGVASVDEALVGAAQRRWSKVARIVVDAIKAGGFATDEEQVQLHIRRIIALVEAGRLEAQGNLRRPRFSEVRLPEGHE
jgi:hypothetical protein